MKNRTISRNVPYGACFFELGARASSDSAAEHQARCHREQSRATSGVSFSDTAADFTPIGREPVQELREAGWRVVWRRLDEAGGRTISEYFRNTGRRGRKYRIKGKPDFSSLGLQGLLWDRPGGLFL